MANRSSPTRSGKRRTREDIEVVKNAMRSVLLEDNPMTVRQVFYRMVSTGVIRKTEGEYKQTVCRLLSDMRLSGEIPFGWIADNTRWQRKPQTYSSVESMLRRTAEAYRRSLWDNQDAYVEIWLEKDALSGVLYDVTGRWDVPLMVTRGYPSLSYLMGAAEAIEAMGKPTYLYYFGDYDPSGLDIPRNVESRLREFAPTADITFECIAVTPAQIIRWNLQTRPTKKTDSRSKGFEGESVEVDAIHPTDLRELAADCITEHIDPGALEAMYAAEREERELLQGIADRYAA
jgi:hypothetical protein